MHPNRSLRTFTSNKHTKTSKTPNTQMLKRDDTEFWANPSSKNRDTLKFEEKGTQIFKMEERKRYRDLVGDDVSKGKRKHKRYTWKEGSEVWWGRSRVVRLLMGDCSTIPLTKKKTMPSEEYRERGWESSWKVNRVLEVKEMPFCQSDVVSWRRFKQCLQHQI